MTNILNIIIIVINPNGPQEIKIFNFIDINGSEYQNNPIDNYLEFSKHRHISGKSDLPLYLPIYSGFNFLKMRL